jgi:hypothetical protein
VVIPRRRDGTLWNVSCRVHAASQGSGLCRLAGDVGEGRGGLQGTSRPGGPKPDVNGRLP